MTHVYKPATGCNSPTPSCVYSCPCGSNNACLANSVFVIVHTPSCFPGKLESLLLSLGRGESQVEGPAHVHSLVRLEVAGLGIDLLLRWPRWRAGAYAQAHNGQWITDLPTTKQALGNTISTKGLVNTVLQYWGQ